MYQIQALASVPYLCYKPRLRGNPEFSDGKSHFTRPPVPLYKYAFQNGNYPPLPCVLCAHTVRISRIKQGRGAKGGAQKDKSLTGETAMTKVQMASEIARLKGNMGATASARDIPVDGLHAVRYEGRYKNGKKEPDYHAIELNMGGQRVSMTARKWIAVLQAVAGGILTPDAIKRENAKIPEPGAKAVKAAKSDGRMYL